MLSERLAAYVAGLRVPQGSAVGEPIRVLPWQHRVLKLFDSDGDVAASIARRNGKTVLAAAIAAAAIDGPLAAPGAENIVAASSFAQATLLFRMTLRLMGDKLKDRGRYRVLDSQNKASIEDRESGTRLLVIGNVPQRAHGMAVKVSVCDELAQWDVSKRDPMLAALRTSAGDDSRIPHVLYRGRGRAIPATRSSGCWTGRAACRSRRIPSPIRSTLLPGWPPIRRWPNRSSPSWRP